MAKEKEQSDSNNNNLGGSMTKLEFPGFKRDGLLQCEYFFEIGKITLKNRSKVVAIHLEGRALLWLQGYVRAKGAVNAYYSWDTYKKILGVHFGNSVFDDLIVELRNLRQIGSLQEYLSTFDQLYPKASISKDKSLNFFLSWLSEKITNDR